MEGELEREARPSSQIRFLEWTAKWRTPGPVNLVTLDSRVPTLCFAFFVPITLYTGRLKYETHCSGKRAPRAKN
jgi:hypothetical protein